MVARHSGRRVGRVRLGSAAALRLHFQHATRRGHRRARPGLVTHRRRAPVVGHFDADRHVARQAREQGGSASMWASVLAEREKCSASISTPQLGREAASSTRCAVAMSGTVHQGIGSMSALRP
jgi:hypothetical protein